MPSGTSQKQANAVMLLSMLDEAAADAVVAGPAAEEGAEAPAKDEAAADDSEKPAEVAAEAPAPDEAAADEAPADADDEAFKALKDIGKYDDVGVGLHEGEIEAGVPVSFSLSRVCVCVPPPLALSLARSRARDARSL